MRAVRAANRQFKDRVAAGRDVSFTGSYGVGADELPHDREPARLDCGPRSGSLGGTVYVYGPVTKRTTKNVATAGLRVVRTPGVSGTVHATRLGRVGVPLSYVVP